MKAGKALEQLVEHLERALAADDGVIIESPGMLKDKVTGELREFDVIVKFNKSHHSMVTAIECKDWKRLLDTPLIETYETKCEHCDINSKIIVSPVGFTKPALTKGKFLGIRCLKLSELGGVDWIKTQSIGIRWRKVLTADWLLDVVDPEKKFTGVKRDELEWCFPFALPFHQVYLDNLLAEKIKQEKMPEQAPGYTWETKYSFPDHSLRVLHKPSGKLLGCTLSVTASFKVEEAREQLQFFEYEEFKGGKIAKGATATIKVAGMKKAAKVVILERTGGSRSLVVTNAAEIESGVMEVHEEWEEVD